MKTFSPLLSVPLIRRRKKNQHKYEYIFRNLYKKKITINKIILQIGGYRQACNTLSPILHVMK